MMRSYKTIAKSDMGMLIQSINLLGCRIDKVSMSQTIERIERFIQSGLPHQIVVVNVAKLVKAREDRELSEIIWNADLVGVDGVPIIWASKLLGDPLPGRVNGTDLMYKLVELAAEKGYRIYFFGARQEVLDKVIAIFKSRYPSLQIAGTRNGYFAPEEEEEVIEEIRNAKADILFVAIGTPFKEKWVHKNLAKLRVPVCHGVGGSFDVVAGVTSRAPLWMQKNGLEWLYRIYQEPTRMWKRYVVTNTIFIVLLLKQLIKRMLLGRRNNLQLALPPVDGVGEISMIER